MWPYIGFMLFFIFALLPASYIIAAIVGVPVHDVLRKLKMTHLIYYIATGSIGVCILMEHFIADINDPQWKVRWLLFIGVAGALGGGVFWFIARPDRPPEEAVPTQEETLAD